MDSAANDFRRLLREHHALLREYGRAQARCSERLRVQALQIERLTAQTMRLHAAAIVRETALAWIREDRQVRRAAPARVVAELSARIEPSQRVDALRDPDGLEAHLGAADLVICQTGCLSHGAYWRVQDHCRRTGKTCVLVERPEALRIVHIRETPDDDGASRIAALPGRAAAVRD